MANSRIAETIYQIMSQALTPTLGGIGPHPVPESAVKPYVTVREIIAVELESLSGRSGLVRTIHQIECWDEDYETAAALREAIKTVLMSKSGRVSTWAIDGTPNHVLDAELYDGARELHQVFTRLQIWWYEVETASSLDFYGLPFIPDARMLPVYDIASSDLGGYFLAESWVRELPIRA